jgi:allophanate hydrolase
MKTNDILLDHGLPAMAGLRQRYAQHTLVPSECIEYLLERIEHVDRPEIWISRVDGDRLLEQAHALDRLLREEGEAVLERLPLFGVPFAIKDNIDAAGMPTTAACPDFAYVPERSATVVEKLCAAGALLIGKTNLDQFATGLVGTRSPHGAVRNAIDPAYISGGSSSGSAVAVALGLVSFSLGTDTAGSGRVPAGLNSIVGLKPTRGLLSTRGVFPACRTLDCVSVFARTVTDAWQVMQIAAGFDPEDSYSRQVPMLGVKRRGYRIAIPSAPEFFGDTEAEQAFAATVDILRQLPDCEIGTADYSAVDTFNGQYRLAALRRRAESELDGYDFLMVPTTPTMPTIADVERDPVRLNSQLGYYTNFVNFFDMAALSIPTPPRADGLPAGITLIGPCGADQRLAAAADALLPRLRESSSASAPAAIEVAANPLPFNEPTLLLAVVGAHLHGQPLNWQLLERGARKIEVTCTAPYYRLYALPGTTPPKPGLARTAESGSAIEIEIWELPVRRFGEFVAEVPSPLAIGSLETADGRWVKGFVCEPFAINDAQDISRHGGWRAYLATSADR